MSLSPSTAGTVYYRATTGNGWRPLYPYAYNEATLVTVDNSKTGGYYIERQAFVRYDTTVLAGKTITGAKLRWQVSYLQYDTVNIRGFQGEWYDCGPSVTADDFSQTPGNSATGYPMALSAWALGMRLERDLLDAAAHINTAGYTGLRLSLTYANPPIIVNQVNLQSVYLDVTYADGGSLTVPLTVNLAMGASMTKLMSELAMPLPVTLGMGLGLQRERAQAITLPVTLGASLATEVIKVPKAVVLDMPIGLAASATKAVTGKRVGMDLAVGYTQAAAREEIRRRASKPHGAGLSSLSGSSGMSSIM